MSGLIYFHLEHQKIFEGGFDFASYKKLNPSASYHAIVLNGLANLSTQYIKSRASGLNLLVDLYLDNDRAGDEKTALAKQHIKNAEDRRGLPELPGSKRLPGFRPNKKIGEITGSNFSHHCHCSFFFGVYPLAPTDDQKIPVSGFKILGYLNIYIVRLLYISIAECLNHQIVMYHNLWISYIWISGCLEAWTSGHMDMRIPGYPSIWKLKYLDI